MTVPLNFSWTAHYDQDMTIHRLLLWQCRSAVFLPFLLPTTSSFLSFTRFHSLFFIFLGKIALSKARQSILMGQRRVIGGRSSSIKALHNTHLSPCELNEHEVDHKVQNTLPCVSAAEENHDCLTFYVGPSNINGTIPTAVASACAPTQVGQGEDEGSMTRLHTHHAFSDDGRGRTHSESTAVSTGPVDGFISKFEERVTFGKEAGNQVRVYEFSIDN